MFGRILGRLPTHNLTSSSFWDLGVADIHYAYKNFHIFQRMARVLLELFPLAYGYFILMWVHVWLLPQGLLNRLNGWPTIFENRCCRSVLQAVFGIWYFHSLSNQPNEKSRGYSIDFVVCGSYHSLTYSWFSPPRRMRNRNMVFNSFPFLLSCNKIVSLSSLHGAFYQASSKTSLL
jgi:hypothetical protein